MDSRKQVVLALVIVSVFIFLVSVLVFVYALYAQGSEVPDFLLLFLQYHIHFMVLMGLFGVFSGLVVYRITSSTIDRQRKAAKANVNIILKFLSEAEKDLVKLLLEKGGMTTQSEISKLPYMTRLKAHRIVKKLEDRGLVHVEKHGKINMVRLVEELRRT